MAFSAALHNQMKAFGPLQLILIDFASAVLPTLAHAQLEDLRRRGLVRLLDSLVIAKDRNGGLVMLDTLDAAGSDHAWSGVLARSFFGSRDDRPWGFEEKKSATGGSRLPPEIGATEDQLLEVVDRIPVGSRALILLIEHSWTADLEIAASEADGRVLANCWISPELISHLLHEEQPLLK